MGNARGRLLATAGFGATARGYEALVDWIESHGQVELVGIESSGSFAAGLVRVLAARAIAVVEVNQPHPRARHRRGKSDAVDAELAARAALSGTAAAVPKYSGGVVEAIRQLAVTRADAITAGGDLALLSHPGFDGAPLHSAETSGQRPEPPQTACLTHFRQLGLNSSREY